MKCNHCGNEWTLSADRSTPSFCPYCGKPLSQLDTLAGVLTHIAGTYGLELFRNGRRLLGYIADLAPELRRERKLLSDFIQCNGNTILLDALGQSTAQQVHSWENLTGRLTRDYWLQPEAVQMVCGSFWTAIGGKALPGIDTAPAPTTGSTGSLPSAPTSGSTAPVPQQRHTPAPPPKAKPVPMPPRPVSTPKTITIDRETVQTDVTELDLSKRTITDLTPLQSLIYLTKLDLGWCTGITDLTPLNQLTYLTELSLSRCTSITDLAPLSQLTYLTKLNLYWCTGITDLTPLSQLTYLTELESIGCKGITDLTPLHQLTSLTILSLNGCTGINDLTPLSQLIYLNKLDLWGCTGITNLRPLRQLTNLTKLDLRGCTGIRKDQIDVLRAALPNCTIYS